VDREVIRSGIDLEEFGLEYPITIKHIIYEWEKVNDLLRRGIDNHTREMMIQMRGNWPP